MLIQEKLGNINTGDYTNCTIDCLPLQWYETNKRIMRKQTESGTEVSLQFLQFNPELKEGDIIYRDGDKIIAVTIIPCECIVIKPSSLFEMASACYEIGNKHLPLFYEDDCLLVPLDIPLLNQLTAQGYPLTKEKRKLLRPLKTTVAPHGGNGNLFAGIINLTSTSA